MAHGASFEQVVYKYFFRKQSLLIIVVCFFFVFCFKFAQSQTVYNWSTVKDNRSHLAASFTFFNLGLAIAGKSTHHTNGSYFICKKIFAEVNGLNNDNIQ